MTDHREVQESLGAYVLGALDPAARRNIDAHLAECQTCRDLVARLSSLPNLLGRLEPDEARGGLLTPPPAVLENVVGRLSRERTRERRRLWAWRAVAVAAAAAALFTAAPWESGPDVREAPARAVAAEAASVTGTAGAIAWEWGTTVQLDVDGLPAREAYRLWAVAEDGRREQAGTWGPTEGRKAYVRGACSIQRDDLERVDVTDTDGEVLFSFEF